MDQYEDYYRLPLLLKRFRFGDKMSQLFYMSQYDQKLWLTGANDKKARTYLPWVLEQLCMLFVDSKNEYGNQTLDERIFRKIYNTVFDQSADFIHSEDNATFASDVIQELGLTQFKLPQRDSILWYRHNYLFNYCSDKVDVRSAYLGKFGAEFIDFVQMAYACNLLSIMPEAHKYWNSYVYVFKAGFPQCMPALTILRDEYIELNKLFSAGNIDNYSYCVRPSYQYAFIQEKNLLYFPLPHLLTMNITSGFMYRLTEGNDDLRRDIGKYVLEAYLFDLIDGSHSYEKVFREREYNSKQGGNAQSPDVIARCNDEIVLFECKSTVPRMGIRWLAREEIEGQINRVADHIKQLYKQMKVFSRYNPFPEQEYSYDQLWGIVVVQEDPYVDRRKLYAKAAEMLKISPDSDEYNWLVRHIKVVELYEIEALHLFGMNCIGVLHSLTDEARVYDVGFPACKSDGSFVHSAYSAFRDRHHEWSENLTELLRKGGYLTQ